MESLAEAIKTTESFFPENSARAQLVGLDRTW